MELSSERGELVLCCHYLEPYVDAGVVKERWSRQDITVGELKFDAEERKVYFFDRSAAEASLLEELRAHLREQFEAYWISRSALDWEVRDAADAEQC